MKHTLSVHTYTKAEVDSYIYHVFHSDFEDMMYDNKEVTPSQR